MLELFDCLLVDLVADETTSLFSSLTCTLFGFLIIELSHCIHVKIVIALDGSVTTLSQRSENVRLCQKSLQPAELSFLNGSWRFKLLLRWHLLDLCRKIVSCIPVLG